MTPLLFWVLIIMVGLVIGSFLNVVIFRLPLALLDESRSDINVCWPNSFCYQCNNTLKWWHNIPIVSFIILRGKCAYCQHKISLQYPLVELLTLLVTCYLAYVFPLLQHLVPALVFSWFLIPLVIIDFKEQLLPDTLTLGLLWAGLLFSSLGVGLAPDVAILGAISGYVGFWLLGQLYYWLRKQHGLGGGDVKLLAALGAWVGWMPLPMLVLLASSLALLVNLVVIILSKKKFDSLFAFGPYLAVAGWVIYLYGSNLPFMLHYTPQHLLG